MARLLEQFLFVAVEEPDVAAQRIFLAYVYAPHDADAHEGIVRSHADDVKPVGIFPGIAPSAPRGFVHDIR
jgi:hypothetical protein